MGPLAPIALESRPRCEWGAKGVVCRPNGLLSLEQRHVLDTPRGLGAGQGDTGVEKSVVKGCGVGKGQEKGRTGHPVAASHLLSLQHSERHKRN